MGLGDSQELRFERVELEMPFRHGQPRPQVCPSEEQARLESKCGVVST